VTQRGLEVRYANTAIAGGLRGALLLVGKHLAFISSERVLFEGLVPLDHASEICM
jgi:hypothetical protein